MAWYLDSNAVIHCLRRADSAVGERLRREVGVVPVFLPLQVLAELRVGVAKCAAPERRGRELQAFIAPMRIAWPDTAVVEHYTEIRVTLERAGSVISEADLWIAATARAAGGTLVTHNTGEFLRVPDLKVEDWQGPPVETSTAISS